MPHKMLNNNVLVFAHTTHWNRTWWYAHIIPFVKVERVNSGRVGVSVGWWWFIAGIEFDFALEDQDDTA